MPRPPGNELNSSFELQTWNFEFRTSKTLRINRDARKPKIEVRRLKAEVRMQIGLQARSLAACHARHARKSRSDAWHARKSSTDACHARQSCHAWNACQRALMPAMRTNPVGFRSSKLSHWPGAHLLVLLLFFPIAFPISLVTHSLR
jgi:hypothetical protein